MANNSSKQLWKIFSESLFEAFLRLGFEVVERPYYDNALAGFRATYVRRYLYHNHTVDGSMVTVIHLVGLPFGNQTSKMVVLASPRNVDNEPVCNTLKMRISIDEEGLYHIVHGDQPTNINVNGSKVTNTSLLKSHYEHRKRAVIINDMSASSSQSMNYKLDCCHMNNWHDDTIERKTNRGLARDLLNYVSHIIEMISPGLIELPTDVKLEILKRLSLPSIIRMSQVNNEFRCLIFQFGESLWRHLCARDFNIHIINRQRHISWMNLYKEAYFLHQIEICRKERALPGLPDRPALPPTPNLLQIEWLPEVLQLPFLPIEIGDVMNPIHDVEENFRLAIQLPRLVKAESLHSLLHE